MGRSGTRGRWAALLALVTCLVAPASAAAVPGWSGGSSVTTGLEPEGIAITADPEGGDCDGLAVSNYDSSSVTMALSNCDGTFDAVDKGVGANPVGIAPGIFDNSYSTGWITANQIGNSVTAGMGLQVFLNFQLDAVTTPTGSLQPTGIAAGDVNHDSLPDAAVTNLDQNTVTVLLGTGTGGGFSAPLSFPTGDGPNAVAIDDFNGDGNPDLATSDNSDTTASVLLGTGTGNFGPPIQTPGTLDQSQSVSGGEFTGDTHQDLLMGVAGGVALLKGNGDGTFEAPVAVADSIFEGGGEVAVTDVDSNGDLDFGVAFRGTSDVQVLMGNGDGTFKAPVHVTSTVDSASDLAFGDFRDVGAADLAIVNQSSSNYAQVLLGQPGVNQPAQLSFGDQGLNTTSATETVEVRNDGAAPLGVSTAALTGSESADFSVQTDGCTGANLAPGASCQVEIAFTPSALGAREAQLLVDSDAAATPTTTQLTGNGVDDGPGPTATTGPVTGTTSTSTSLTGTVDPRGSDTAFYFEYGTTTAYGSTTVPGVVGDGVVPKPVVFPIDSLTPGELYHYRLVAQSANGTAFGQDAVFVANDMPVPTTGSASSIGPSAATLNGTVDPKGLETTWWFEYGPQGGQLSGSTEPQTVPFGAGGVPVSSPVSGLDPRGAYSFRLVAMSLAGRSDGSAHGFTTTGLPPSAETGGVSDLTGSTATLGGTVNPNGGPTQFRFDYGLSTTYSDSTDPASAGSGGTDVAVSRPIDGLQPNRTYHYRVHAFGPDGTTAGSDRTFTTSVPPGADTGPPAAVGSTTAILTGGVDPRNLLTTYRFEWGTSTDYGSFTPARPAGSAMGEIDVSESLAGLSPGTEYHYRLVAEGSDGSVATGPDQGFTTSGAPVPIGGPLPLATTLGPTKLGLRGVVVAGSVEPRGQATSWFFQYGTTAEYGRTTGTFTVPAVAGPLPVGTTLRGLAPGRRVHYRLVAVSSSGQSLGADRVARTRKGKRR